jgi:hypothetical protein
MPYEVFRGRVLSAEELAVMRLEVETFDTIEQIDDEMRALIIRNWSDLAAKLSPEQWLTVTALSTRRTSRTMLYAVIAHDRPDGLEQRITLRAEHFNYLHSLGDKVVFAGALFGNADKKWTAY